MNTPFLRIFIFFILSLVVLVFPWQLVLLLCLGFTIYFPLYVEIIFFGFLYDMLYAQKDGFLHVGLFAATALLVAVYVIKINIRR